MIDVQKLRSDFPILAREVNGKQLVYFDNAATSQKPKCVISAMSNYYEQYNSNAHRANHTLADEATTALESARENIAGFFGLDASYNNAVAPGIVMGIMIIPFISSLSDDVINSVPDSMRQGSLALGMTKGETIRDVVIPAALPGIISAALLGMSRALGETMIVVMAAGMRPNLTANPLEDMTTVTVRIVASLTGDQEFESAETLSAFALGLVLFVVTLTLNLVSVLMIRRFREKYRVNNL